MGTLYSIYILKLLFVTGLGWIITSVTPLNHSESILLVLFMILVFMIYTDSKENEIPSSRISDFGGDEYDDGGFAD